jgi:hypothetical protein
MSNGDLGIANVTLAVATRVNVGDTLTALVANAVVIFIRMTDLDVCLTVITFVVAVAINVIRAFGCGILTASRYGEHRNGKKQENQENRYYLSGSF